VRVHATPAFPIGARRDGIGAVIPGGKRRGAVRGARRRAVATAALAVGVVAGVAAVVVRPTAVRADATSGAAAPMAPAGAPRIAAPARYRIDAWLDRDARTIAGVVTVRLANPAPVALDRVVFDLYPNRFRTADDVNDLTRGYVYPRLDFVPGGIDVETPSARGTGAVAGAPATARLLSPPAMPADSAFEIALASPLAPGAEVALELSFRTLVPVRYGPFGSTEEALTAVAGWYPTLAALDAAGGWHPGEPPEPSDVSAVLTAPPDATVVLGDRVFPAGHAATIDAEARGVRTFAAIAYASAVIERRESGGTSFTLVAPEPRRERRLVSGPRPEELVLSAVVRAVERRPAGVPAPAELMVAEVPLRWNLATETDGPVVVSDRAMHVQELLRGFHEAQIAQATYAQLLRQRVFACESPADRNWVQQAVAWGLADALVRAEDPSHRDVHWWIDWFDTFAIVDRFEFAPKVPFVQSFFPNAQTTDDVRESVFTWAGDRPPAHLVLTRLDHRLGTESTARAIADYVAAPATAAPHCLTFAEALEEASGAGADSTRLELAGALAPASPSSGATVDPALRPAREQSTYQFVLDTADVEVSSTEFGLAALFVARKRHDYTKDFAINPFYTERSYGVHAGPRVHFGEPIDPVTYPHNLFAFYRFAKLDRGFKDDSEPDVRTSGEVGGFGLRYDYSNVFWYDNPTDQRTAHLFVDWADKDLGGQWGFVRFGGRATATTPLWTYRTIGAVELLAGFEQPTSRLGVPLQEEYSLGGRRALRGVSVNARLARNIGLARFEIRQDVFPEFDLNLLDLLTYRRPQVKLFVDTGQVDDSAGRALDPEHWAIAGGVGVNALYDFLGFFPGRAYLELGTRFDRDQTDFQVLFGTRQAF